MQGHLNRHVERKVEGSYLSLSYRLQGESITCKVVLIYMSGPVCLSALGYTALEKGSAQSAAPIAYEGGGKK
jgi:hypothetical protein